MKYFPETEKRGRTLFCIGNKNYGQTLRFLSLQWPKCCGRKKDEKFSKQFNEKGLNTDKRSYLNSIKHNLGDTTVHYAMWQCKSVKEFQHLRNLQSYHIDKHIKNMLHCQE